MERREKRKGEGGGRRRGWTEEEGGERGGRGKGEGFARFAKVFFFFFT